jgi:hypothetical protein
MVKKVETADVKNEMETPEKLELKVVNHSETDVVVKNDTVIVFQAKHPLTEYNYDLLSHWIRKENEATGLTIVLAPYSVNVQMELVENGENNG